MKLYRKPTILSISILVILTILIVLFSRQILLTESHTKSYSKSLPILRLSHAFANYIADIEKLLYDLNTGNIEGEIEVPPLFPRNKICSSPNAIDDPCPKKVDEIYEFIENEFIKVVENYFGILNNIGNEKIGHYGEARNRIKRGFDKKTLKDTLGLNIMGYMDEVDAAYNRMRRYEKDMLARSRDSINAKIQLDTFLIPAIHDLRRLVRKHETYFQKLLKIGDPNGIVYKYLSDMDELNTLLLNRNHLRNNFNESKEKVFSELQKENKKFTEIKLSQFTEKTPPLLLLVLLATGSGFALFSLFKIIDGHIQSINTLNEQILNNQRVYEQNLENKAKDYELALGEVKTNNKILRELGEEIFNFKTYESLAEGIRKGVTKIYKWPDQFNFTLYHYEAENSRLKAYISRSIDSRIVKKEFSVNKTLDSKSVEIFNNYSIYNNYTKDVVIHNSPSNSQSKEYRKSRMYRLIATKENKRLGLISFQSTLENAFDFEHKKILDVLGHYVEAALDYDTIRNATATLGEKVIQNSSLTDLLRGLFNILKRIIRDEDNYIIAIGIVNDRNNTIDFYGKGMGEIIREGADDLEELDLISIRVLKRGDEIIIGDIDEFKRDYPNISFPSGAEYEGRKSLIYVPITYQGTNVGVLTLQSSTTEAFSQKHFDFIKIVSVLLAQYLIGEEGKHIKDVVESEEGKKSIFKINETLEAKHKRHLLNLLKEARISELFQNMPKEIGELPFIVVLESKYNKLKKEEANGRITKENSSLIFSSIVFALAEFFKNLDNFKDKQTLR